MWNFSIQTYNIGGILGVSENNWWNEHISATHYNIPWCALSKNVRRVSNNYGCYTDTSYFTYSFQTSYVCKPLSSCSWIDYCPEALDAKFSDVSTYRRHAFKLRVVITCLFFCVYRDSIVNEMWACISLVIVLLLYSRFKIDSAQLIEALSMEHGMAQGGLMLTTKNIANNMNVLNRIWNVVECERDYKFL